MVLEKINHLLNYIQTNSTFYKKSIPISCKISALIDIKKLPFTTKDDISMHNSDFLCVPKHKVRDFITTSGTVGDPISFYLTQNDLKRLGINERNSFKLCNIKKGNKVLKNQINKKADFILLNYGGIRAPIPKGNITLKNAYKVMPFENELVLVKLSGLKVKELLTYLFKSKNAHPISNISLKLNNTSYQDVIINNRKFNENKNYYILTSNYLQQGGDKMNFFKSPILLYNTKYKIRTALIDYFKETDTIKTELDNRFSYAK
jgi:hypothetical protein